MEQILLEIPFIFSFRSEVYVEPFQTYIMDFFLKKLLTATICYMFLPKKSVIQISQGPKNASTSKKYNS